MLLVFIKSFTNGSKLSRSNFDISFTLLLNSANAVKSYIQDAYNNYDPAPEYVALIGDAGGSFNIPTYLGSAYHFGHDNYPGSFEGDHPYSQLNGNDLYPEVLVGRISIRTTDEFATIVNKILIYEIN